MFFHSTIELWNNLSEDVKKKVPSFPIIKTKLKNLGVTNSCKYFNVGSRKEYILHCQLRNNASNLNAHLKVMFLSDDWLCEKYGYYIEDWLCEKYGCYIEDTEGSILKIYTCK